MWEGIDKRQFPRAKYNCLINIRQKGKQKTISTKTENIGAGGLCVMLSEPIDIFSEVGVEIFLLDNMPPVSCRGNIVWVIKQKDYHHKLPLYDIGIEFIDIIKQDKRHIEAVVEQLMK